ncbi:hypothetical protein IV203_010580 [Nitzschia inconspicua]|uniref:Uncharacterized protein n=1 Tax=Nitzschia inconspicua TaxID=303405 RepID=A0A9K3PKW2_9STRA|nr:hypothetical protein IV203_010580 [Nitzschia inconspicua]
MSSTRNHASGRSRDDSVHISGRIPKKAKNSSNGASPPSKDTVSTSANNDRSNATDDTLDAITKARMAMMMFEEVTGEPSSFRFDSASSNGDDGNGKSSSVGTTQNGGKNQDKSTNEDHTAADEAKKIEEKKRQEEEEERNRQEEEARQRQRADGEAKRRAFKPKIATALDSLL